MRYAIVHQSGSSPLIHGFKNLFSPQIGSQDFGDGDAAVTVLVLFDDCGDNAAGRQARGVEGVYEFVFAGFCAFESDAAASCLVVAGIGCGADFFVFVHAGDPDFNVVGFGHGRADVFCGEHGDAVMQAQVPGEFFGFVDEFFECVFGVFGAGELEHFDFVELVSANHAPFLCPITAGFFAIAGGVGEEFFGQVCFRDDFVPVEVDECGFRGGQEELYFVVAGFEVEYVVGKFGELSGGEAACFVEYVWGQYKFVAVGDVAVDEVVEQGPFEARAVTDIEPESRSAHFDAAFVVDQAKMGDEVDVVIGIEVGCGFFTPGAYDAVVFFVSGRYVVCGYVGEAFDKLMDVLLDFREFGFNGFDAGRDVAHFRLYLGDVSARFFYLGDLGRDAVAFCAQLSGFCDVCAAFFIPDEQVCEVDVVHAFFQCLSDAFGVFANEIDVEHEGLLLKRIGKNVPICWAICGHFDHYVPFLPHVFFS